MERERLCVTCNQPFSYRVGKGTDRKHCSAACRETSKAQKRLALRQNASVPCRSVGCSGKVVFRIDAGLCERCYCHIRRTGQSWTDPGPRTYKRTMRPDGYVVVRTPGHPLARADGALSEHRRVAYDVRAGVCEPCYWCRTPLSWDDAVIDHLNENRSDNRPENLVVSCNDCNRARGSMLPFFRTLQPERFDELMALMFEQVKPCHDRKTRHVLSSLRNACA